MQSIEQILYYIVMILLTSLFLYLATRIITGKKNIDAPYMISLIIVAIIALFAAPALTIIATILMVPELAMIVLFIVIVYAVRYLLKTGKGDSIAWEKAIWITFLTLVFIFLVNRITMMLFGIRLIPQY